MGVSAIDKALCIHAVENLMARHVYAHASCRHREEILELWSQSDDIVFAGDWGYMPKDKFWNNYAIATEERIRVKYMERLKKRPDFAKQDFRRHETSLYLLASPILEVAEDGKSARGLWYTPGFLVPSSFEADRSACNWFWERYGADFVCENGEWKFLHLRVAAHLMAQMDIEDWTSIDPAAPDVMGRIKDFSTLAPLRQDTYNYLSIPTARPGIPVPYQTLEQSATYKEVQE